MSFDAVTYALAKKYTNKTVDEKLSSVYKYKGSVESYEDLPSSGNDIGDTYDVLEEGGQNFAWNGTSWDPLGVNQSATNDSKGLIKLSNNTFTDTTLAGNTTFTPEDGESKILEKVFKDLFIDEIDFSKGQEKLRNLSTYDDWTFSNMNEDKPFFEIVNGVIYTTIPANNTYTTNYNSQLFYKPLTLVNNKYYVATVTLKSSVARKYQLLVQSNGNAGGDWSVLNTDQIFDVGENETINFITVFKATNIVNTYLFGLMCGHIEGDADEVPAAAVEISGFSLKEYDTNPIINIETIKEYVDYKDEKIMSEIETLEPYFDDDNMAVYIKKGAIFNDDNYSVYIADYYVTPEMPSAEEEVF